jgi:WhiB family redox-sensing transcriptional regulator
MTLFELLNLGSPDVSEWVLDAACAGSDPEAFFPTPGVSVAAVAKQVCASCPVRTECLEDALERGEYYGVRGGLSAQARRRLAKQRRAADLGAVA